MDARRWWTAASVWACAVLLLTVEATAQDAGSDRPAPPAPMSAERSGERAVPAQVYEDFNFPDPDRPWGRPRYLDPYRHDSWHGRRSYYGGHRRYYYDDYSYRFGVPYGGDPYGDDLERAYRQGTSDGRNFERFEIQAERGLEAYLDAMDEGHAAFSQGAYGPAARHFLLAAELNQGDPSARLCAAHCQMAIGRYDATVRLLRRAFELQPKIVYLPLDVRAAYGVTGDFERHLAALRQAVDGNKQSADLWLLLGYYDYFSGNQAEAAEALARAGKLRAGDRLIESLSRMALMSVPPSDP